MIESFSNISQALVSSKSLQDNVSGNIVGAASGATEIKSSYRAGPNGIAELVFERAKDVYLFGKKLSTSSAQEKSALVLDYHQQISDALGNPNSPNYLGQKLNAVVGALCNVHENTDANRAQVVLGIMHLA